MTLPTTCGVVIGGVVSSDALAFAAGVVAAGDAAVFIGPPPTTYTVDEAMGSHDQVPDASEELSDKDNVAKDDEGGIDVDRDDDKEDDNVTDVLPEREADEVEVDDRVLVLVELKLPVVKVSEV
jgi:hypothetical protein